MKLPQPPPELKGESLHDDISAVVPHLDTFRAEQGSRYLHWDELRRRNPPHGLTHQQWWMGIWMSRLPLLGEFPLRTVDGRRFRFAMTQGIQRLTHEIDSDARGSLRAPEPLKNKATQNEYLIRSLTEEALTSSQLEGAVATAQEAKQIIRAGRKPNNDSERMVLNNYHAMEFIREHRDAPLSVDLVCTLHRIMTTDTLEDAGYAGRFRTSRDDISVIDSTDGTVVHVPPDANELPHRMEVMCGFANGEEDGFVHPVVRAVLLHFWLAYDHPFCDGNGRTARALFYWAMLNQGYWLTEYVSISRVLKKARAKYDRSFLYSETAPYDATHFLLYQLQVVKRSIVDLHTYLDRKVRQVREVESMLRQNRELNHRQLALLSAALRDPAAVFTMTSHKNSHRISHETARQDLYKLVEQGLLKSYKRGRQLEFVPVEELVRRLRQL